MPERTVKLGSMFYIDDDGRGRRADEGSKIQVHPDFVKKFDDLNRLAEETEVEFIPPIAPEAVEAEQREVPKPGRPRKGSE
jgi:hypothetical protein